LEGYTLVGSGFASPSWVWRNSLHLETTTDDQFEEAMIRKRLQLVADILVLSAFCGAQTFYHARTDLKPIKPLKMNWPKANSIVVDPNFGNQIVRITDGATFKN